MQRIQDSGSNYQFYDHDIRENPSRSLFDLGHIHTSTFRLGALYPVYCQWTLPRSDYTINVSDVIRSMPMTVPLMSRLRVFFHFYYCRYSELWDKGKVFVSKGANGQRIVEMPYIDVSNTHNESLWRYFNLPQFQSTSIVDGKIVVPDPHDVSALHVSALPFMAYQKIYRDYYLDRNFQFDENGEFTVGWFPDEEEDFRIKGDNFSGHEITPVEDLEPIDLTELRYRDFAPDYFVSAVPRPQLGEPVGISLAGIAPVSLFGTNLALEYARNGSETNPDGLNGLFLRNRDTTELFGIGPSNSNGYAVVSDALRRGHYTFSGSGDSFSLNPIPFTADLQNISAVTIDQLRLLNCNQIELEKMARCSDGFYGTFMEAFFGEVPRSAHSMRPTYIGGTYQPVIVSDVVQTSSTVDTATQTSVQGNQTGKGFASDENANIGHIYSDDFGLILGIMSIMPDTYYAQGIERQWSVRTQDDLYFPDRAGLSMQEIRQKEIFADRENSEDSNEKIWAYQNRYDEYRFRQNYVTGYVGDSSMKDFSAYIQTRWFDSSPTYSQQFATTKDNIDMEQWFAKNLEPPFVGQIYFDVRAVQPMPYRAIPQGLFGL